MPERHTLTTSLSQHSLAFVAETAALAELGAFLRDTCGGHPRCILIELAVTEVVVNAIRHGAASNIKVTVTVLENGLELSVADDGVSFDTSQAQASAGELREGGYGVGIIQKAASELSYKHASGWGTLSLTFPY